MFPTRSRVTMGLITIPKTLEFQHLSPAQRLPARSREKVKRHYLTGITTSFRENGWKNSHDYTSMVKNWCFFSICECAESQFIFKGLSRFPKIGAGGMDGKSHTDTCSLRGLKSNMKKWRTKVLLIDSDEKSPYIMGRSRSSSMK